MLKKDNYSSKTDLCKQTVVNQLDIEGETLTNNEDIAESFNIYFSNIGPNLVSKIGTTEDNLSYIKNTKSELAVFHPTTTGSVYNLLSGLSGNKATGIDKISSKIKIAAPVISDTLTHIFNQSFFPDEWKIARVPLFKNGQRNLPENYRPISVLPVIS